MSLEPTIHTEISPARAALPTRDRNREHAILLLETIPTVMRNIRTAMRAAANKCFTVPQFRILLQIGLAPKTNAALADWMGVTAPTMSRMVSSLQRKKLVQRKCDKKDRRQQYLTLTNLGKKETERARELVRTQLAEILKNHSSLKKESMAEGLRILREIFL